MSAAKFHSIAKLLRATGAKGGRMLHHAERLHRLNAQLRALLPADMAPHCRIGNIDRDGITLLADSPVWAARLRFQARDLARKLVQLEGNRFEPGRKRTVKVHIAPASAPIPRTVRPTPELSPDNAKLLRDTANGIGDPALAAALERLARNAK